MTDYNLKKKRLLEISDEILEFLLKFRETNPNFTFPLRSRDSAQSDEERLSIGQWFQGSNYIFVPLFKIGDNSNKIKTIGFVINFEENGNIKDNYIEISFTSGITEENEIKFHKEIADKIGLKLNERNNGRKYYDNPSDYIKNLTNYITGFRNAAIDLLKKYELENRYLITEINFNKSLSKIMDIKKNLNEKKKVLVLDIPNSPPNLILFGPPGTGKTYNTINKALEIIGEDLTNKTRKEIKDLFDTRMKEGQIVFTTFHQSMSYEDFIEGIKPETVEESVIYEIKNGIFRLLCIEAAFSIAKNIQSVGAEKALDFSSLYDQFIDTVETSLNASDAVVKVPTRSGGEIQIVGISSQGNIIAKHIDGIRPYTISKQRLIILDQNIVNLEDINNLNNTFREIIGGSNTSAYYAVLKHIRSLQPIKSDERNIFSFSDKLSAVSALTPEDFKKSNGIPHVIIIDEINRGNISQIFGELITLIEDDKRLGKDEAIMVTLPYSKVRFGVPPNIYIIGTMNTADKSVEALDAALRRRFSFEEMAPNPSLIATEGRLKNTGGVLGTINLPIVLGTINKRIDKLLDKDHLIGHSYFMSVSNLKELKMAFQNKIIPLLQEYFYGDYGKIGLVLGKDFFESVENTQENVFAEFYDYDGSEFSERTIYKIKNISKMDDNEITNAIHTLLN